VRYQFLNPSFPGSFAVVQGEANRVSAGGVTTSFYLRDRASMASAYGQEISHTMEFLSGLYGQVPFRDLTVVETEAGAPNGYASSGILFLAPKAIGNDVNSKLVANELARQWWGGMVSGTSRNQIWIENGMARYSEMLLAENTGGAGALETLVHDAFVE